MIIILTEKEWLYKDEETDLACGLATTIIIQSEEGDYIVKSHRAHKPKPIKLIGGSQFEYLLDVHYGKYK